MSKAQLFFIAILILIIIALPYCLKSEEFKPTSSLYSDIRAKKIGDLVSVLIFENASASNVSQTTTKKNDKFSIDTGPGSGKLDFIPLFGASGENKNEYDGQGETKRMGDLKARMTCTVVGIRENGDLIIEGNRVIGVNEDKETLTLSGVVRSQDINSDNSVYSYNIADAKITYKGKGPASTAKRPGILTRIINWIL
jgi:flagellar L-ring protein precursor FlgH